MRKLKIALADLAYEGEANRSNLYVPLSIGFLSAATKARFGADVDVRLFKDPRKLIAHVADERPDVVGLSSYYWNDRLNAAAVRRIAPFAPIVMGGPSIDSDRAALDDFAARWPDVFAFIQNEGEDGFVGIIGDMMSGPDYVWDREPPPSVAWRAGDRIIHGKPGGLATDLATLPSPYLDGTLEEWTAPGLPYQPMIQSSRLCPFTCSFCVSGKNRGKLRAFPLEVVRAEIDHIAERFADRPEHVFYFTDENFGILERDLEVAEMINEARARAAYPRRVFYYNDKRFTAISQRLQEMVGDMCWHGVMLSLQSENPETLKAIKRRNLPDERISEILAWAHGRDLKTSTELIFGLPMETRASFLGLLDKCARLGFQAIQCYNLILFDGIEMNRPAYREEHALRTMRRLMADSWMVLDGEAVIEAEEVVVSSSSFSAEDYRLIRKLNVLFHAIFVLGFEREALHAMAADGGSLTAFAQEFLSYGTSTGHDRFLADLDEAIDAELHTDASLAALAERVRAEGVSAMPAVVKIQPVFARRLAEAAWARAAFASARAALAAEHVAA